MKNAVKSFICIIVLALVLCSCTLCACNEENVGKKYGATLINDIRQFMREDFLEENRTYGVYYENPNYNEETDIWSEEWMQQKDAPSTREFVITNEEEYLRIFKDTSSIGVNLETQMLVVHMFTKINSRPLILTGMKIENNELFVKFKDRPAKPWIKDSTMPGQGCFAILMNKYDITSASFEYDVKK